MNKLANNCLFIFCFFTYLLSKDAFAQHEADNWFFGRRAGLSFTNGLINPVYGSQINQTEGVATISDSKTGRLLFYSDGITVWDNEHHAMPNGRDLRGSSTSTQSALIVPFPGKKNLYYLFTVKAANDNQGGLYYSIVDLTLNNGQGDVLPSSKNVLLESNTTEKLTAVPHANSRDFWILSHAWNSNEFLVYRLTPEGVILSSRSPIGTVHKAGILGGSEAMGYLKASPNNKLLASAVFGGLRPFELYDFNNQTGSISNYRSLGNFSEQYGVSFSPDNTKLYLSALSYNTGSYQFDLTTANYSTSGITVSDSISGQRNDVYLSGSLELGIDGQLYAAIELGRLAVIKKPNQSGQLCEPQFINPDLRGGQPLVGLPNFVQNVFDTTSPPITDPDSSAHANCNNSLSIYPNPLSGSYLNIDIGGSDCPVQSVAAYTTSGQLIFSHGSPTTGAIKIDVTKWLGGQFYFLVLKYEDRQIVRKILRL